MTGTTVITTSRVIPMHQHQQSLPHRKRFRPESEFSHLRLLSAVRELPHTVGTSDTDSQQDEHDSGCVAEHPTCTAEADRLKELEPGCRNCCYTQIESGLPAGVERERCDPYTAASAAETGFTDQSTAPEPPY
jgi:hypothetical protein